MKFRKVIASLAGALLVALPIGLWAPQAQAIPAFARQMGMACNACHYQHFPVLNAFGRAFKEGGFIMTGADEKLIEGTGGNGLSLPSNLNAAIELYFAYVKTNGPTGAAGGQTETTKNSNNGTFQLPNSSSVFYGGRVAQNIGFEAEVNVYPTPAGLLNVKLPVIYDAGSAKVGAVVYSTAVYGPSFGLEVLNTGANAVHLFNQQNQAAISAQQYINTGMPAAGVDLVASNEMGFVVAGKWLPDQSSGSGAPSASYFRIAATPADLIPGFDFGIGAQLWAGSGASTGNIQGSVGSGVGFVGNPVGVLQPNPGSFFTKASAVDAQLMGDVGGLPLLVIASYARAPSDGAPPGTAGGFQGNIFNPGTATRSSFNMGAELGISPQKWSLQAGMRRAHSGFALGATSNATDNAWLLGVTYAMALNARFDLTYSQYSGDMYSAASQAAQGAAYMGDRLVNLTLVAAF